MTPLAGVWVAVALVVSGCGSTTPAVLTVSPSAPQAPTQVTPSGVLVVPASNHVTGTYPAHCTARGPLPDPVCTPGSIRSDVDPDHLELTVCKPNWSRTVRPPQAETERIKTLAMAAYGIPASQRAVTELDHDIPLVLGGASATSNLWPQVSDLPGQGFRNSKDAVESRVHTAVCRKVAPVPWRDAVMAFAHDWRTAERKLGIEGDR